MLFIEVLDPSISQANICFAMGAEYLIFVIHYKTKGIFLIVHQGEYFHENLERIDISQKALSPFWALDLVYAGIERCRL